MDVRGRTATMRPQDQLGHGSTHDDRSVVAVRAAHPAACPVVANQDDAHEHLAQPHPAASQELLPQRLDEPRLEDTGGHRSGTAADVLAMHEQLDEIHGVAREGDG
jgi:hypothetical protein